MLVVIGSAVGLASLGGEESSDVVASSDVGRWSPVEVSEPGIFSGEGDLFISAVTPWKDQVVVLGTLQPPSGGNTMLAWTSTNGTGWERRELEWPTGCDPYGGLVARGDQLIVTCTTIVSDGGEDVLTLQVATTTDLTRWTLHTVTTGGQWFGSLIGPGPGDTVVVQRLEAADPNTTVGAHTRVWSSDDLVTWNEIVGETPETFLDGQVNAIRSFGEVTIMTGIVNEWPTDVERDTPADMRPAVWVSTAGSPFRRTILATGDLAPGVDGAALDVAAGNDGYVAVGSADTGSTGLAWHSSDLTNWTMVTVASPAAAPDGPSQNGLYAVISRSDGTLLATGSGTDINGQATVAWQSTDDGRSWHSAGPGPSLMTNWDNRPVGMSTFAGSGSYWIWEPASSSPDEDALAFNAGPLADFDPGIVIAVDVDDGPGLFIRRDEDGTVEVWSRRDPKSSCRIVTTEELVEIAPGIDPGAGYLSRPVPRIGLRHPRRKNRRAVTPWHDAPSRNGHQWRPDRRPDLRTPWSHRTRDRGRRPGHQSQ